MMRRVVLQTVRRRTASVERDVYRSTRSVLNLDLRLCSRRQQDGTVQLQLIVTQGQISVLLQAFIMQI